MPFDNRAYQREWQRRRRGSKPRRITTEGEREAIRALRSAGVPAKVIGRVYGLSPRTVWCIARREGVYALPRDYESQL